MGLPNYPHASASFPTVTFGNENKSTPKATGEVARTAGKGLDLVKSSGGFVAEFIRNPLTELFGIWTDNLKARRMENAIDLQLRVRAKWEAAGMNNFRQIPMSIGVPLLEAATLEESPELRDIWASLITNFTNEDSKIGIEKSFVTVLRDLSPLDVLIFEKIYSMPEVEKHCVLTEHLPDYAEFELQRQPGEKLTQPDLPAADIQLSIATLFRLQCLQTAKLMGGPDVFNTVYTTTFGHALFAACTTLKGT
jgi:hypothetical protein